MALSMYQVSIPVFAKTLGNLSAILDKAAAFAQAGKIEPAVLLGYRLAPGMFPLSRQILVACDTAKGAAARLAGEEPPKWEDKETAVADFQARIGRTIDFCNDYAPARIDGSETRAISLQAGGAMRQFTGQSYLLQHALPNFFFHVTTAYAILRHTGVDLGKLDYLGKIW